MVGTEHLYAADQHIGHSQYGDNRREQADGSHGFRAQITADYQAVDKYIDGVDE